MSQTPDRPDEDEDRDERRKMDPELKAMAAVIRIIEALPGDVAQTRVVRYISERYGVEL